VLIGELIKGEEPDVVAGELVFRTDIAKTGDEVFHKQVYSVLNPEHKDHEGDTKVHEEKQKNPSQHAGKDLGYHYRRITSCLLLSSERQLF
jgi:hypothetical protein